MVCKTPRRTPLVSERRKMPNEIFIGSNDTSGRQPNPSKTEASNKMSRCPKNSIAIAACLRFGDRRPRDQTDSATHEFAQSKQRANRKKPPTIRQHLRRLARETPTRNLMIFLTLAILLSATASVSAGQSQETPLPTVIVRGFLNYRTTVDGTVLLFTPDAGQQPPVSTAVQPKATPLAQIDSTSTASFAAPHPSRSLIYTETLAARLVEVEPTSVLATSMPTATDLFQTMHLDSNSFRHQPRPPAPPEAIAVDAPQSEAQPDQWRPIQMTPPLKLANLRPTTNASPSHQETTTTRPAVQADDITDQSQPKLKETSEQPGRLRRPALGFNGQGLRPRVPGTGGAVSPSLQSRSRSNGESGPPSNSINGIRRPGLGSSGTPARAPQVQIATDPAVLANVSSAFQNRLSNASTRLKNRFKHRQPAAAAASQPSTTPPAPVAAPLSSSGALVKPNNNLIAPESLLDVASSIEQPTSAARSLALAPQHGHTGSSGDLSSSAPVVGSDEIAAQPAMLASSPHNSQDHHQTVSMGAGTSEQDSVVPVVASNPEADSLMVEPISPEQQAGIAALSRAGEQRPRLEAEDNSSQGGPPKLLSGQLQQGSLSSGPLNLDSLFMSDQPSPSQGEHQASSEPAPSTDTRSVPGSLPRNIMKPHNSSSLNGKLNGWLGQHHNKFVPRPPTKAHGEHGEANLSNQLAANIQQLAPTAAPNPGFVAGTNPSSTGANTSGATNLTTVESGVLAESEISAPNATLNSGEPVSMQTITRTYSTILETTRTRMVPMQVKSSTGILTITEDYIMTKMMTAYQTIPAMAEFILADQQLSTRAPYEIFDSPSSGENSAELKAKSEASAAQVAAPAIAAGPVETQEQPISLDSSPKSANNWLHDFSNLDGTNGLPANNPLTQDFSNPAATMSQEQILALLEQRARDANLAANFPLMSPNGEPLDQLPSQLDPSSLLADGALNIPDLNNPLVLAAAIQNPQLAAVILAAQQLKLKRQQQQKPGSQQPQPFQQQLQQLAPSFSTSFSTTVRPATYTARDTMYTTRLVSFRDGRTVRTRTVSEPGSVVEQVLTTIVTETIPVTITIKPTGVLGSPAPATQMPGANNFLTGGAQSNQATINNALFATQLANILARRQQQLQTSFNNPSLINQASLSQAASATPQQLLALQQYLSQQQQQQQPGQKRQPATQQFQPNFQQLLQSMASPTTPNNAAASSSQAAATRQAAGPSAAPGQQTSDQHHQATPLLQQAPKSVVSSATPVNVIGGPLTTTLTSLQTRTYTVHNAFKTIFRTITSTVLIPTVLSAGSTLLPAFG